MRLTITPDDMPDKSERANVVKERFQIAGEGGR